MSRIPLVVRSESTCLGALGLLLLGGCACVTTVTPEFSRLVTLSTALGTSTSPGPGAGEIVFGSLRLSDALEPERWGSSLTPRGVVGRHGRAEFLPRGKYLFVLSGPRSKVKDGVFHFSGMVTESDLLRACGGLLSFDPSVRVEFADPAGTVLYARGTLIPGKSTYGGLDPEYERVWKGEP